MRLVNRLFLRYLRHFHTEKWARKLGVKVGFNTTISSSVVLSSEPYLISIGNHVQVTSGVTFFNHGGGNVARRQYPAFDCFGKIVVEDWAYIGSHSLILPGVTIGEGALVAAGSVVTKSVAPKTVVGGNPAKYICTVDEYIEKNSLYNVSTKGLSYEEKKAKLLQLPEGAFIKK